jgi:enamine deaminase RidA (YjgF/YER057c/UK114 family)
VSATFEAHNPATVPRPVGQYAQGLEVPPGARVLYVSGQIPENLVGGVPGAFEDQCRLVWSHIGDVLLAAGMTYGNLVKVTTFLTDRGQARTNGEIRREVLGPHEPALTVVIVQTLNQDWLLEIEAIAAA